MFSRFSNLLIWSVTLFLASISMGSLPVEEAVQKRNKMFKSSQANIKKLSKFIRSGDISASSYLVDFHVKWSGEMLLLFPAGSEASTSQPTGSDTRAVPDGPHRPKPSWQKDGGAAQGRWACRRYHYTERCRRWLDLMFGPLRLSRPSNCSRIRGM